MPRQHLIAMCVLVGLCHGLGCSPPESETKGPVGEAAAAEPAGEAPDPIPGPDPIVFAAPESFAIVHFDVARLKAMPWMQSFVQSRMCRKLRKDELPKQPAHPFDRPPAAHGVDQCRVNLRDYAPFVVAMLAHADWDTFTIYPGPNDPNAWIDPDYYVVGRTAADRQKMLDFYNKTNPPAPAEYEGVKYLTWGKGGRCLYLVGETGLYMAHESSVHRSIKTKGRIQNDALAKLWQATGPGQIRTAGQIAAVRKEFIEQLDSAYLVDLAQLKELAGSVDAWTLSIDLKGPTFLKGRLDCPSGDAGGEALMKVSRGLRQPLVEALDTMASQIKAFPAEHPMAQLHRAFSNLLKGLEVKLEGKAGEVVTLNLPRPAECEKLAPALVAYERLWDEQGKARATQIARACEEAIQAYRSLDNLRVNGETGALIWSGRVRFLPWLGNAELEFYNRTFLDRRWDAAENLPLVSKIDPLRTAHSTKPGTTTWKVVPAAQGGVVMVEGGEGAAVPWAEPDEVRLDGADPLAAFGKEPAGGYTVVLRWGWTAKLSAKELREKLKQE